MRPNHITDPDFQQRFWSHVNKTETCWLWTACRRSATCHYGVVKYNKKMLLSHRVAWELTNGPIPDGLCVLHHCDVRHCVRPDHLFLGTHSDNSYDASRKCRLPGNRSQGEKSSNHKLTENQVREIRTLYLLGKHTQRMLAKQFGIDDSEICRIVNRHTWTHI